MKASATLGGSVRWGLRFVVWLGAKRVGRIRRIWGRVSPDPAAAICWGEWGFVVS